MDMQDEILSKLNESSCEEYEPFEFKFENIPKPGDHSDGLCVFYNTKSVKKIHVKKDTYSGLDGQHKTNRVYMMILFELIDSQKKLFVGTVHLKAKPPFFEARYLEVQEYFLRLEEFIKELQENEYIADEKEFDEIPCILTGDFNDETDSKAVLAVQNPEIAHKMQFKSAYCIDGVYPEFSTYKYRYFSDLLNSNIYII